MFGLFFCDGKEKEIYPVVPHGKGITPQDGERQRDVGSHEGEAPGGAQAARPRAQCCRAQRSELGELGSSLAVCRLRRVVLWAVASCLSQPKFWTVAGRFASVRTLRTRDSATALPICDNRHRVITQCKVVISRN